MSLFLGSVSSHLGRHSRQCGGDRLSRADAGKEDSYLVVLTLLTMQLFGWMIADPVCSIFIAVLIALSVGSLIADSIAILMQRSPKELDHR